MTRESSDPSSELSELREQHRAVVGVLRVLGRAGGDLQSVLEIVAELSRRRTEDLMLKGFARPVRAWELISVRT
jgi:hypothetical protein